MPGPAVDACGLLDRAGAFLTLHIDPLDHLAASIAAHLAASIATHLAASIATPVAAALGALLTASIAAVDKSYTVWDLSQRIATNVQGPPAHCFGASVRQCKGQHCHH